MSPGLSVWNMNDDGGLFIGCLIVPEGTKNPHEENSLGFGTSMGLSDGITVVETHAHTCVKQGKGDAVYACVYCVREGGETRAGVERKVDTVTGMVQGGGRKAGLFQGRS